MIEVYYFGCWEQAGHHLRDRSGRSIGDHESTRLRIPRDFDLDGGPLFLPHPERVGRGAVTYLPACNVTVLAWWGSPWDKRGAVNSAVILRGRHDADGAWTAFTEAFPRLASQLMKPETLPSDIKEKL